MWHAGLSDRILLLGRLHPHRAFDGGLVKIEITYSFLGARCKRILIAEFRLTFELVEFSFFEARLLHRRDYLWYLNLSRLFLINDLTLLRWLSFDVLLEISFFVSALLQILVRRRNSTLRLLLLHLLFELPVLVNEDWVALLDTLIMLLVWTK